MNDLSFDSSDDEADLKRNAPESPPDKPAEKKQNVATSPVKNEEIDPLNNDPPPSNEFDDTMSDTSNTLMDIPYYTDECIHIPRYAICCLNCNCPEDKIMKTFDPHNGVRVLNNCGNSIGQDSNTYLYHKACCHNFQEIDVDYLSPMQQAILNSHTCEKKLEQARPLSDIQRLYNSERRKEVQRHNEDFRDVLDRWNWKIETYPDYMTVKEQYHQRIDRKEFEGRSLIVLDLFSGIGTAAVVLKKLKLPIAKMVHIEHDPVAVYVSKFNHKDDGIEHIYLESFEEIYGGKKDTKTMCTKFLWKLIDEHGPFDLVVAGAPCQNYSEVNAYRSRENYNASYLPKVGLLISDMNDLQFKRKNREYPVLFMSENVLFKDSDNVSTYYRQRDVHGLPPIQLDGKDFSPMARNRFYWTNMPPTTKTEKGEGNKETESATTATNVEAANEANTDPTNETAVHKTDLITSTVARDLATPRLLLDDGWIMGVSVLATEREEGHMTWKANTSMASLTRINDERMTKIKPTEDGRYLKSTYSVKEREIMMGLPEGYVSKPMKELFREIALNGFLYPEMNIGKTYKSYLDRSLWHFAKKCNFKVKEKYGEAPFFQVMISAPAEGRKVLSYYDEEEYCKHLIGNGWSVPVVEHIFKGIREMYSTPALFRTYEGFDYEYPWPPYSDIEKNNTESVDVGASDDTTTNSEVGNAAETNHPDPEDANVEENAENGKNLQVKKARSDDSSEGDWI